MKLISRNFCEIDFTKFSCRWVHYPKEINLIPYLYSEPKHFGWSLWSASIPVEKDAKSVEVWCKAVDSNYNSQPESFKNIWNLRGINNNAYHRVVVNE